MKYLVAFLFYILCLTVKAQCNYSVIKLNGKFGVINKEGEIIIEPEWDWAMNSFHCKSPFLVERDSLFSYVDFDGNLITKSYFKDAEPFENGLASVLGDNGKYGLINTKGDTVACFCYDEPLDGFIEGAMKVVIDNKWGLIDTTGSVIVPMKYKEVGFFFAPITKVVTFSDDTLLIYKDGSIANDTMLKYYEKENTFSEQYLGSFRTATGFGRLNYKGDTIIPPTYTGVRNLTEGSYIVNLNGKYGLVNQDGTSILEPKYERIWGFYGGLAMFKNEGKWGFLNRRGKVKIKAKFDKVGNFYSGLAYAVKDGKAGFINTRGRFVIKPIFEPCLFSGFY